MLDVNKLIKEKREIWYQAQDLRKQVEEGNRLLTKEESALYDTLVEKMNDIQRNIDTLQSMNEMSSSLRENTYDNKGRVIGNKEEDAFKRSELIRKWMRGGSTNLTPDERRELAPKDSVTMSGDIIELRADPAGLTNPTYVEQIDIASSIIAAKKYYGGWMSACDEIRTDKGNPITWPTVDDTAQTGSLEAAGTDAFDDSTAITLGYKQLNAYYYSSTGLAVANDSLEDASFDMNRVIGDMLGERLWRVLSTAFTTGTGSSQCGGIASNAAGIGAPVGVIMGKHCKVSRDRILQLIGKVDYAYHQRPGTGFMMNSAQMYEIAGLASSTTDNRPLWQPSMVAGVPDKIEGFPYWINNDLSLPSVHTGAARHILFGDFKQFKIRYGGPLLLVRLVERYAPKLQTGFIAIQRADSRLMLANATTYAPVKYMKRAIT